ncbi:MAG TPA: hypothetical protein VGI75_00670, partial [Pirellulales bacterium]
MDNVKKYLEIVRKHHFWILCVVAAIVALVVWKMSTGKLSTEFASKSTEIDGQISGLKTVLANESQPHTDWASGVEKQTDVVRADVRKAWDDLYQQQKKEIFVWPALGDDFIKSINATEGTKDEIRGRFLDRYLNTVKSFVNELTTIVDSEPPDMNATGGGGGIGGFLAPMIAGPAAGAANAGNHIVIWDSNSLGNIVKSFDWQVRPTTLLVKYAQEELWVYKALCNVIKTVNEGATSNADAPIKVIQEMKIAYLANDGTFGGQGQRRIYPLVSTAGDAAAGGPG